MNLQFKHLLRTTNFWNLSWQILMWKESLQVRTQKRTCVWQVQGTETCGERQSLFSITNTRLLQKSFAGMLSISACPPKIPRTMRITCVRWIVMRFKYRRKSLFFLSIRVTIRNTWYDQYLALYGTMIWTMWYEKKANYAPYRCIEKAF